MESMIEEGIRLGLEAMCFTEHLELDAPQEGPESFYLDLDGYERRLHTLRSAYAGRIDVRFGIELGLQEDLVSAHQAVTAAHPFDYVIGSLHLLDARDPYYPEFWEGRCERETYEYFFTETLANIRAFPDFDALGHLDYIVRYGPNGNRDYSYAAYAEYIDPILLWLIEHGKALEVNTAGLKYALGHPNPEEGVLARYRALGGELITIGSDAHRPEHIAYAFPLLGELLTGLGFRYYAIYKNRRSEILPLG